MDQKKKCGCNTQHKRQAAWLKCYRAHVDPHYGNKKTKDVVEQTNAIVEPEE